MISKIKNNKLFAKKQNVLIALSGGSDSMYLLNKELNNKKNNKIVAAHVNYNFRPESKDEQALVESYCKNHNVTLKVLNVDDELLAKYDKLNNIQAKARQIRFDFFKSVYDEYNIDCVLIAQHMNDFVETAIMQNKRSKNYSFYGIKSTSYINGMKVKRPLLDKSKLEILDYCKKHKIEYAVDSSNLDDKYERNRIRKLLNSKKIEEISDLYTHFQSINKSKEKVNQKINQYYNDWVESDYSVKFYKSINSQYRLSILYEWLSETSESLQDYINVSEKKLQSLDDFLNAQQNKNKAFKLMSQIEIKKLNDKIVLSYIEGE